MTQSELLVSTARPGIELAADAPRYSLLVARDSDEVLAAQRLRHQVFAGEMGATLHSAVSGLDVDEFDGFCEHLVVRDDRTGEIVGTYRMLPPERAREAGRLYSDTEFDLANLADLRPSLVEAGRSCVHPDHRSGGVVLRYRLGDGSSTTRVAFIGTDSLIDSVRRVVRLRGLVVELHVLDEVAPGRAETRRELAALVQREAERVAHGHVTMPAHTGLTSSAVEVER